MNIYLIVDVEKGRIGTPDGRVPSGSGTLIGWQRLAQALQASGDVRPSETLTHFIVTDAGLELRFK